MGDKKVLNGVKNKHHSFFGKLSIGKPSLNQLDSKFL